MAESQKPKRRRSANPLVLSKPLPTPPVVEVRDPKWIPIDWDKVQTIEDIKIIMANMGLGCHENSPNFEQLKKFL